MSDDCARLKEIEQRLLWLACWTIHNANHLRPKNEGDVKVGGHPTTLSWLGGVQGHRTVPPGAEHFGQTGTVGDLYRHYGIDFEGIVAAASTLSAGRPNSTTTILLALA